MVDAAARAKQAEVYIRQVRQDLFGSPRAPFRSQAAAARWLQKESADGMAGDFEQRRAALFAFKEHVLSECRAEAPSFPRAGYRLIVPHTQAIHVQSPGPWGSVLASTEALEQLAAEAKYVADYIPCLEWKATLAILTAGVDLVDLSTPLHTKRWIETPLGTREDSPDVKGRNIRPKDVVFIRFLRQREEQPPTAPGKQGINRGVRKYWEEFVRDWSALYPPDGEFGLSSWRSAIDRYNALCEQNLI